VVLLAAFLGAGHHSTTSAMASLINEVFSRPAVRDLLRNEPGKIPLAVEETLRLRPPFFGFFRRATKPVSISGTEIPQGCDVYMGWAAANRDPTAFEAPTDFKMQRPQNRHLTFGYGIHSCPGSALARMELRVLIEELLRRTPDLKIQTDAPVYQFGGGDYSYLPVLEVTFTAGVREA
jgi:cytochrome P450